MSCNEHGNLRKVNVGVKVVNQPKRNWDVFTVAGRDEARCTIIEPVLYRRFRR